MKYPELVEIGRRAFRKATYPGEPDWASMAIHDAAPTPEIAREAYWEMMSILADEKRYGSQT